MEEKKVTNSIKRSKNSTWKKDFYFLVLKALKTTSNLSKIKHDLGISKQDLNYFIHKLKQNGQIIKKGRGWYEVLEGSKNMTKYGDNLPKDFIRGHAYVWEVKIPSKINGWDKRIEILTKNNINFKLVGAKFDIPRIKVLGRKIWLCKDHLRIFECKDTSFYEESAPEARRRAFITLLEIVNGIESKLGIILKPLKFDCKKEHYALIKNDLAIDCNKKGVILRISDDSGEWLLIDDSLEKGGELENIGKDSLKTNIPMQKWWNNHKETGFKVTPDFILNAFAQSQVQLLEYKEQNKQHLRLIKEYRSENKAWRKHFTQELKTRKDRNQTTFKDFL